MRDSTLNTRAAAEAKRAAQAAIDEACYHLARIALDIVSVTDRGIRTYDPAKERRHAIAMVKCVAEELGKDLYAQNPRIRNWNRKSGKQEDLPAADFCAVVLRAAIPALERTRPATMRGRSADLWRERNQLIVETRKLICQKYGFDPARNPATRDKASDKECGNSIISQALKKLETQLGWFEKYGFKKPAIALSESRINEICRTWDISPPD
jgi:hypothetical protein